MNYFLDLDGTLIDSKQRLYKLFCYLNPTIHISYEDYWELKKSKVSHRDILTKKFGYSETQFLLFQKLWMSEIEKVKWLNFDQPFEKIEQLLNILSKDNSVFLVTSRQFESRVINQLDNFGWLSYFKKILVTRQKIEKFQLIIKNAKVSPEDYIIGDTGKDIETGKKLGINTIAVLSGFLNEKSLLEYNPNHIFGNINELLTNENTLFKL